MKSHKKVADLIAADFATCDDSMAHSYLRVAHALATADLGITRISKLYKAAAKRTDHHRIDMLEVLGPVSADAIAELRKKQQAAARTRPLPPRGRLNRP